MREKVAACPSDSIIVAGRRRRVGQRTRTHTHRNLHTRHSGFYRTFLRRNRSGIYEFFASFWFRLPVEKGTGSAPARRPPPTPVSAAILAATQSAARVWGVARPANTLA